MLHIPYRGIAPAITDLLGGQTQAMFPGLAAALPHIRSGRMRALAVTGKRAQPAAEGRADAGGARLQGLRRDAVVRLGRPGRHAGRRRARLNETPGRGAEGARPAREAGQRSGRAAADDARAVRRSTSAPTSRAGPRSPRRATSTSTTDRLLLPPAPTNAPMAATPRSPPTTTPRRSPRILAEFVAGHPSRGWSDAVEHEAHRTFLNWLGCAIGAARHEAADAALAAVQMLQPAPQATRARPRRAGRHGERRAAQRHHLAHLRLRRHAPEDHHPSGRPGGLGGAGAGRAHAAPAGAT